MPVPAALWFGPGDLLTPAQQGNEQQRQQKRLKLCVKLHKQVKALQAGRDFTPGGASFASRSTGGRVFACALQCTQCTGRKADGQRCTRRVCIGAPLCFQHALKFFHVRAGQTKLKATQGGRRMTFGGLFACDPSKGANAVVFEEGDPIICYAAENIRQSTIPERYGAAAGEVGPYVIRIAKDGHHVGRHEDGACRRSYMSLVNTSAATANTVFAYAYVDQLHRDPRQGLMAVLNATKQIRNGQEILVDDYPLPPEGATHSTKRWKPSSTGCRRKQ